MGPRLSSLTSGVTAAQSTAFHALCAGEPRAERLIARLPDDLQAELKSWQRPADVDLPEYGPTGVVLRFDNAEKEVELGVDASLNPVPADSPDCISVGHVDLYWLAEVGGRKVVYVVDMKRSEFTAEDGPDTLQLTGYGLALAIKLGADAYVPGIWSLKDGRYWWGDMVELDSARAVVLAERAVAAMLNQAEEYVTGAHCNRCYGREHCPAWVMPPELAETSLAPLCENADLALDNDARLKLLLAVERVEDMAAKAKKILRAGPPITDPVSGKVYKPVPMPGRESASVGALRSKLGPAADEFITKGKPFEQWRWMKGEQP